MRWACPDCERGYATEGNCPECLLNHVKVVRLRRVYTKAEKDAITRDTLALNKLFLWGDSQKK